MIKLSKVCVISRINANFSTSGLDEYQRCFNKEWFMQYPYTVSYTYNSKGFRDSEWPIELQDAIWCIGDSFTVGIGAPLEHTWPYLLSQETGIRTINVSMDGASNDWIARMSREIAKISPKKIIHQWSYTHRRENQWHTNSTEQEDIDNFILAVTRTQSSNVIHSMIPRFELIDDGSKPLSDLGLAKRTLKELGFNNVVYDNTQLDYSRDYYHYDIKTAKQYVKHYIDLL